MLKDKCILMVYGVSATFNNILHLYCGGLNFDV
jgi:hypothetical protein